MVKSVFSHGSHSLSPFFLLCKYAVHIVLLVKFCYLSYLVCFYFPYIYPTFILIWENVEGRSQHLFIEWFFLSLAPLLYSHHHCQCRRFGFMTYS